jgi:hypothetical protein
VRGQDGTKTIQETKNLGLQVFKPTRDPKLQANPLGDLRPCRLGCEQNIDQLIERRIGALFHFVELNSADRMLHDQHRMIRRAESFLLGLRQRIEGVRDQRDREAATLLYLD